MARHYSQQAIKSSSQAPRAKATFPLHCVTGKRLLWPDRCLQLAQCKEIKTAAEEYKCKEYKMKIYFNIYTNTNDDKNATTLSGRFTRQLKYECQEIISDNHSNGDIKVSFFVELLIDNWIEIVFNVIQIAQTLGRSWTISEDISECIDLWSNDINVSGIISCHIYCTNIQ